MPSLRDLSLTCELELLAPDGSIFAPDAKVTGAGVEILGTVIKPNGHLAIRARVLTDEQLEALVNLSKQAEQAEQAKPEAGQNNATERQ